MCVGMNACNKAQQTVTHDFIHKLVKEKKMETNHTRKKSRKWDKKKASYQLIFSPVQME